MPLKSPLAGDPTLDGESYLLATVGGQLLRVDAATGELLGQRQLSEPLHSSAQAYKGRVLASGADGTLLVATLEASSAPAPTPDPAPAEATSAATSATSP